MEQKGFTKQNIKKLIKFEGISKELPWILFFAFILFAAYGWNNDVKQCRTMMYNDCYLNCRLDEVVTKLSNDYPGTKVNCWLDNRTKQTQCEFAGVQRLSEDMKQSLEQLRNINVSILP
jgi:hypothetical protein